VESNPVGVPKKLANDEGNVHSMSRFNIGEAAVPPTVALRIVPTTLCKGCVVSVIVAVELPVLYEKVKLSPKVGPPNPSVITIPDPDALVTDAPPHERPVHPKSTSLARALGVGPIVHTKTKQQANWKLLVKIFLISPPMDVGIASSSLNIEQVRFHPSENWLTSRKLFR